MKTSLEHLPEQKQRELSRITEILFHEFEDSLKLTTSKWKKQGRILKIILFGSHARNDWIESPQTNYISDYDILIVVSHKGLTDSDAYWRHAEDRFVREKIANPDKPEVNFILHTMAEINDGLVGGKPFFINIINQGIILYEVNGHRFKAITPLSPKIAYEVANEYYEEWFPYIQRRLETFSDQFNKGLNDTGWRKDAAFTLHQAVEASYNCLLLVLTNHAPFTHNLNRLRSFSESLDARLVEAWPRYYKRHQTRFSKIKNAYIQARYSKHYQISMHDLEWVGKQVVQLQSLTKIICEEHLEKLKQQQ
ncbi:MAG: nucleotidyltransferase [Robiginitomaculum sp.]|nr:MAG: nucleotidyltransferase [Robiginitomaculum sp.]